MQTQFAENERLGSGMDSITSLIQALWRQSICREPTRSSLSSTPRIPTRLVSRSPNLRAQTFAPTAVPPSNLPNVGEDGLAIVDVSTLTTAKILDKRSSPSGVEYKCELEPLWMAADLVEKRAGGTRSHPELRERSYTKGTPQDIEDGKAYCGDPF
jgi:hypothetical protein